MADPKARARVQRLLRGDLRNDDLAHLFLYARDRCDGRESVREIGDFVAHHDERTKGLLTRVSREWFAITRFHAPRWGDGGPIPLNGQALPSVTPQYLIATVKRLDDKHIKAQTGLSKAAVYKMLPKIISNFEVNKDGTYAITPKHDKQAISVIKCLFSFIVVAPAFEGTLLFKDFCSIMKSNGLISNIEINQCRHLKDVVQLFAVSIMHNTTIILDDGIKSQLKGSGLNDVIQVGLPVALGETGLNRNVYMEQAIYSTNLKLDMHCDPALLALKKWDIELELTPDGRLGILI